MAGAPQPAGSSVWQLPPLSSGPAQALIPVVPPSQQTITDLLALLQSQAEEDGSSWPPPAAPQPAVVPKAKAGKSAPTPPAAAAVASAAVPVTRIVKGADAWLKQRVKASKASSAALRPPPPLLGAPAEQQRLQQEAEAAGEDAGGAAAAVHDGREATTAAPQLLQARAVVASPSVAATDCWTAAVEAWQQQQSREAQAQAQQEGEPRHEQLGSRPTGCQPPSAAAPVVPPHLQGRGGPLLQLEAPAPSVDDADGADGNQAVAGPEVSGDARARGAAAEAAEAGLTPPSGAQPDEDTLEVALCAESGERGGGRAAKRQRGNSSAGGQQAEAHAGCAAQGEHNTVGSPVQQDVGLQQHQHHGTEQAALPRPRAPAHAITAPSAALLPEREVF